SSIPEHLKRYFLEQLRKIRFAIEEYQITGSAQVAEIVEATFGKAILNQDLVKVRDTHDSAKGFWNFMAKTALVVSTFSCGVQLLETTVKVFPELAEPFKQELVVNSENNVDELESNFENEV
ncbi:TPA: hypothetical protein I7774_22975, partial [Vibrio vulnificus]|nr:hypothetical protein [Vibrio vulnificus]